MGILHRAIFTVGLLFFGCMVAAGQTSPSALAAPSASLNIPAQPMQRALNEFARQTGLQVVVRDRDVAPGLNCPAIVGTFTPESALQQLLANSGLSFGYVNEHTIAIRPPKGDRAVSR